jgi:hypothetical protein
MSEIKTAGGRLNLGLLFPLAGLLVGFWLLLATVYIENALSATRQAELGDNWGKTNYLHPYIYLLLLTLAILVVTSLIGRRIAGLHREADPSLRLHRNVYTFTTVTLMSSLIAAVIYALVIFFSNQFVSSAEVHQDPVLRLLTLYVPILVDAALIIFGILRAFVVKPKGASK